MSSIHPDTPLTIFDFASAVRVSFAVINRPEHAIERFAILNPSEVLIVKADIASVRIGNPALDINNVVGILAARLDQISEVVKRYLQTSKMGFAVQYLIPSTI